MEYKLAKQLKDAGFPRDKCSMIWKTGNAGFSIDSPLKFPTLEELIDACEGKMYLLIHGLNIWSATGCEDDELFSAKTPIEAVAKLWLELNKK